MTFNIGTVVLSNIKSIWDFPQLFQNCPYSFLFSFCIQDPIKDHTSLLVVISLWSFKKSRTILQLFLFCFHDTDIKKTMSKTVNSRISSNLDLPDCFFMTRIRINIFGRTVTCCALLGASHQEPHDVMYPVINSAMWIRGFLPDVFHCMGISLPL